MKILVINCGSSSIKYQLFDMEKNQVLCSGLVERIGLKEGVMTHKKLPGTDQESKKVFNEPIPTHKEGMDKVIKILTDGEYGVIKSLSEIKGVGHRVVHGGTFTESVIADEKVIKELEKAIPLAPIHNPANIQGLQVARELFAGIPNVVVFDTAFHQTMPKENYMYPIPYEYYDKYKIRKYGFHGTSHQYIAQRTAAILNKKLEECNLITVHLGNGSSLASIKNGKCQDTSMGLTPLDGVMMGTRCGSIDPAVVAFMCKNCGLSVEEADKILSKQSGLQGICGCSDMRDVEANMEKGDEKAELAFKMLAHSIRKYIGAYIIEQPKLDAIVFTAGIGENDCAMRKAVIENLEHLGIVVDYDKNNTRPKEFMEISKPESRIKVLVVRTNEELAIAKITLSLIGK